MQKRLEARLHHDSKKPARRIGGIPWQIKSRSPKSAARFQPLNRGGRCSDTVQHGSPFRIAGTKPLAGIASKASRYRTCDVAAIKSAELGIFHRDRGRSGINPKIGITSLVKRDGGRVPCFQRSSMRPSASQGTSETCRVCGSSASRILPCTSGRIRIFVSTRISPVFRPPFLARRAKSFTQCPLMLMSQFVRWVSSVWVNDLLGGSGGSIVAARQTLEVGVDDSAQGTPDCRAGHQGKRWRTFFVHPFLYSVQAPKCL